MRQISQRLEVVTVRSNDGLFLYLAEHRVSEIEHGGVKRSRHADIGMDQRRQVDTPAASAREAA